MAIDTINNRKRPPYLLGLLCLMPLIGAFVGLGLLLYGIIHYKDKWLSIIGAAGILFTVAIYSLVFYSFDHSAAVRASEKQFSQQQLNGLVANVEFYKLVNGRYPDNLEALKTYDNFIFIFDPLQSNMRGKSDKYNYKKVGNKYLLFSSGVDGVPGTKDDLYPNIKLTDSSKVGFMRIEDLKDTSVISR